MVSLSIINRMSPEPEDDGLDLGTPDEAEAKDLNRHVERCAMRYRMFSGKLSRQSKDISQVKILMYILGLFILATSHPAQELFTFLGNLK